MTRQTIDQALQQAAATFANAGILDDPRRDALHLMAFALMTDLNGARQQRQEQLTPDQAATFQQLVAARATDRVPVSRLIGVRGFWTLDLQLSPDTLDPRPDSETLIDAVIDYRPDRTRSDHILDLGTGSGCLLLALLSEYPNASGVGVDIAPGAIRTARDNAARADLANRSQFLVADWDRALGCCFDVIISNPPYIESTLIDTLAPEVQRHDPRRALDGGDSGLDAYRALIPRLAARLPPDGHAFLEIGADQAKAVTDLVAAAGLNTLETRQDLGGRDRCLVIGPR